MLHALSFPQPRSMNVDLFYVRCFSYFPTDNNKHVGECADYEIPLIIRSAQSFRNVNIELYAVWIGCIILLEGELVHLPITWSFNKPDDDLSSASS